MTSKWSSFKKDDNIIHKTDNTVDYEPKLQKKERE